MPSEIEPETSTSSLSSIGSYCQTCHRLDFLPIPCTYCNLQFCSDHIQRDNHQCTVDPVSVSDDKSAGESVNNLFPNRSVASIEDQTKTLGHATKERKKAEALAILQRNFSKTPIDAKVAKPVIKSKSRVVELARLRQRVKAGDPKRKSGDVPMSERLNLIFKSSAGAGQVGEYWFAKGTTVGKTLDLITFHLGIRNVNDQPNKEQHLHLYLPKVQSPESDEVSMSDSTELPFSQTLTQVNVKDGDTIWIVRGSGV